MGTYLVHIWPTANFDSTRFEQHMKGYSSWARLTNNVWMVSYNGNAAQLRDTISHSTEKDCDILTINISGDGWATLNIDRALTDWMTENV